LVALVVAAAGCGPGADDAWVARVDGREVTLAELQRAVEARLNDSEADPPPERDLVQAEELERLVVNRLILNRAIELGVEVSDAEVDGRIQLVHGTGFEVPDESYRAEVLSQMTLERAALVDLANKMRIPETAVAEHFASNPERYRQPARIQIRQIVVEDREQAAALRAEVEGGAEFATVARLNSLAPEAAEGGLLPPFAEGEMPEAFDPAFKLREGQLSPVIESSYGFHIFTLVDKLPAREVELGEVREEIRVELQRDRLEELKRGWLLDLRRAAEIEVNERLLESAQ
jgi:foldase protein PrsA